MATLTSNSFFLSSSYPALRQPPSASLQCAGLPTLPLPHVHSQGRISKSTAYSRKVARNVVPMATGDAPAEIAGDETPEIVKTVQEAWDKVEDKYAVSTLAVAAVIALSASTGMISAIDRLPLVPGVLELVGIGYTGWFAYKNLVYEPDREALIQKIKDTYNEVLGSSS